MSIVLVKRGIFLRLYSIMHALCPIQITRAGKKKREKSDNDLFDLENFLPLLYPKIIFACPYNRLLHHPI